MFECMEVVESIYECVLEPSYKKSTRQDNKRAGYRRKMSGETASSKNYSEIHDSPFKHIKRYVYHQRDRPKQTCLIHGPGYSSY